MANQICPECRNNIFNPLKRKFPENIEETLKLKPHTCWQCLFNELDQKIKSIKAGELENILKDPLWNKNKLIEGLDYYNENGLMVFTEYFHLKKGYCCKNQCRHCPYN
ncbi:DUF5522 domain-containing protein [Mangrovivirga sp. M17]|uniref:DUF5522 domain-containing protein n=1 Tax=Mangrovivirga halotolerans TaxID=2993936 RepID=A0ABT3RR57_9BACT|nr:DUF5522 domain-containing protein [Mangrovivirga halotolerans]MCX2744260.1 DUF5522 domain-containing protein [Mangrovivirga halotolerans]